MTAPVFQNPPPIRRRTGPSVWDERLDPLRDRPNEWALVHTVNAQNTVGPTVAQLRRRLLEQNPEERWEFTTRGTDIYARFGGSE